MNGATAAVVNCGQLVTLRGPARARRGAHQPTLPVVRAVITEILTAHFFVTRPHYLRTMQTKVKR